MNRGQLIRVAHQNPKYRQKLISVLQAHDKVSRLVKEAGRGLPLSKIQKYAETGVLIMSAYRGKYSLADNKKRNESLRQDILSMGVRPNQIVKLDSSWTEFDSGKIELEKSFAVLRPLPFKICMGISNKYDQDAFIWSSEINPLAMYSTTGKATFAVDRSLALVIVKAEDNEEFSKGRGGASFTLGFNWNKPVDWDRRNPITNEDILARLDLAEVPQD